VILLSPYLWVQVESDLAPASYGVFGPGGMVMRPQGGLMFFSSLLHSIEIVAIESSHRIARLPTGDTSEAGREGVPGWPPLMRTSPLAPMPVS